MVEQYQRKKIDELISANRELFTIKYLPHELWNISMDCLNQFIKKNKRLPKKSCIKDGYEPEMFETPTFIIGKDEDIFKSEDYLAYWLKNELEKHRPEVTICR